MLESSLAPLKGTILVRDTQRRVIDPATGIAPPAFAQQGRLQAAFRTVTSTGTDDPALQLSSLCEGVVGVGEPAVTEVFDVGALSFDLGEGLFDVMPDEQSLYRLVEVGAFVPMVGREVRVQSDSSSQFGAFDVSIPAATPLDLIAPRTDGLFELLPAGFRLEWDQSGDGDAVLLTILPDREPGDRTLGGQIRCVVPDTGCYDVPASAASFLVSDLNALTFTVNVSRIRAERTEIGSDAELDVSLESQVTFTVVRGS